MTANKLNFSIPANNQKIIELFNKIKKEELDPSPNFQRKLVWRKQHKYRFIETILQNFPFPEVYIAPGKLDTDSLSLKDQIVDGQQRLTTIANYIEGKDVFSLEKVPIKKFAELTKEEKEDFLNYEVSVRYLKNADENQIKDIFQRINSTEYSLNTTERLNAQWGDSEFVCFGKQIVEPELDVDTDLISYKIDPSNRKIFLDFFHTKYNVFTENDINRMLALQYVLTLLATICEGTYFRRNDKVQEYIESYFEEFVNAGEIEVTLVNTIKFIDSLDLDAKSYWFNKANIFTLVCEISKLESDIIDKELFKEKLLELEQQSKLYMIASLGKEPIDLPSEVVRYIEFAKEAVNDKSAREYRAVMVRDFLRSSIHRQ